MNEDMVLDASTVIATATGLAQLPAFGPEAVASAEAPTAATTSTAAAAALAPVAGVPMGLDELPTEAQPPVEGDEQVGIPMNLSELPEWVLQMSIDEAKDEIKQFVEMTTLAKDEGDTASERFYKAQMRKQVEFLRDVQRELAARRAAVPSGT